MILNNRRGHPIGDVEIPGVDSSNDNHIEITEVDPSDVDNIEIQGVDVDILDPEAIDIVDTDIPPTNPVPIETSPVHQVGAVVEPMPATQQVEPDIHRSSRFKTQAEKYTPSMPGSKYSYVITELESQGLFNPDAHLFFTKEFYQAEPDVVSSVSTQLSLKSGLRAWGYKAYRSVQSKTKKLHFRNTFKPEH